MVNLKVTAYLNNGFATFDDWSPDLAGLLEWLILDIRGMASPNPTPEDVARSRPIVLANMPLEQGEIQEEWYWKTSSPCYSYRTEYTDKFRKRWAPGIDSPPPNWGKRKQKWDGASGTEKNYDLPNYVRVTDSVTWYCVGDRDGIERLLQGCTGIGKKRNHGHGQVNRWEVLPHDHDWHLFHPDGYLMRPMPRYLFLDEPFGSAVRRWGWRPPAWLPDNKADCIMPTRTVKNSNG